MSNPQVRAMLNAIAGRVELLDCLAEGVTDKPGIERELGKSRSTLTRWLIELEEADLIRSGIDGYQITALGELAYREYRRIERRYSDMINARPLLKYLPANGRIDSRLLEGAEIVLSTEFAPQEPIRRLEDIVRKSNTRMIEGSSPVVLPRYVEFFHEMIISGDLDAEFVLATELMDYLTMAYHAKVTDMMEYGRGTFWSFEGDGLPFALAVIDDEAVWVGVHKGRGAILGAIINTAREAIDWGREQYHGLRERAEPVDPSDLMLRGGSRSRPDTSSVTAKHFPIFVSDIGR